jgi:rhamnulokinase
MKKHIAIDLGASNGRVLVGDLKEFEVVHRFVSANDLILGELYWDIQGLFREIKVGLRKAFERYPDQIISIGIDTWGVDSVLLDSTGALVSLCYHYRDERTDGLIESVSERLGGKKRVWEATGVAFQPFNTLFQLAAMQRDRPLAFRAAHHLLSIPDLLAYWLTGVMKQERTQASTTQLYDTRSGDWAWDLIDEMGFPRTLFGEIVDSGTILGPLTADVAHEVGAPDGVLVIATASHDTASAVAAVPTEAGRVAPYISSGTWSLLGVELQTPLVNTRALEGGFTNEVSADGKIRFLMNIMGMWIQQECVRYWEQSETVSIDWKELDAQTLAEAQYEGYIDVTDRRFRRPNALGNLMVDRVVTWCTEHQVKPPQTKGQFMVAVYRGLAKAYADAIIDLGEVTDSSFDALHIIGGGCKNEILNQWSADQTGLTVYAGPSEATALGNLMVQAWATGQIESLEQGREQLRRYQQVKIFEPAGARG